METIVTLLLNINSILSSILSIPLLANVREFYSLCFSSFCVLESVSESVSQFPVALPMVSKNQVGVWSVLLYLVDKYGCIVNRNNDYFTSIRQRNNYSEEN